jgi:hypothetical protein
MSGLLFNQEEEGDMLIKKRRFALNGLYCKMDPYETGCEDAAGSVLCPMANFDISHV